MAELDPSQADGLVLRCGTRGSPLARAQGELVRQLLAPHVGAWVVELVEIVTSADRQPDRPLREFGGKGLFVKEIEEALREGRIDLAVHSAKDVPTTLPPGLVIAATPPRGAPNDVWISRDGKSIADLPRGALVGTSSPRRQAQVLALRPDLRVTAIRGNIQTRLRKVRDGVVEATLLAQAGLERSGLRPRPGHILPVEEFIPAGGQGALVLQTRGDDEVVRTLLEPIHDPIAAAALDFERGLIGALSGNCLSPIGVCALPRGQVNGKAQAGWIVRAFVGSLDGRRTARVALLSEDATPAGLRALQPRLLEALMQRGAKEILEEIRASSGSV